MTTVIFGAQGYALSVYKAIKMIHPDWDIPCFFVSSMGINTSSLAGLPVVEIAMYAKGIRAEDKRDIRVLIATPENVMPEIEDILDDYGFTNHQRVGSNEWAELMDAYHRQGNTFKPLSRIVSSSKDITYGINSKVNVCMYVARSHMDQTLDGESDLPNYIVPLQVGAVLTDKRVAEITDDMGDSISRKNGNYSELTGLYWLWRNILKDPMKGYYGLSQYRRMMMLTNEDLFGLQMNDVDVVLPYPLMYEPNIHVHHERYLRNTDWKALMSALEELHPNYSDVFTQVLEQKFLYNYNVILAKSDVLRDYCEWLFPILERVEELSEPKGWERADRYIGYMAESLETLYFMKNKDKLKIAHTGVKMLV